VVDDERAGAGGVGGPVLLLGGVDDAELGHGGGGRDARVGGHGGGGRHAGDDLEVHLRRGAGRDLLGDRGEHHGVALAQAHDEPAGGGVTEVVVLGHLHLGPA